jgi:hypothetical protein
MKKIQKKLVSNSNNKNFFTILSNMCLFIKSNGGNTSEREEFATMFG